MREREGDDVSHTQKKVKVKKSQRFFCGLALLRKYIDDKRFGRKNHKRTERT
jgi:hypothetical protein